MPPEKRAVKAAALELAAEMAKIKAAQASRCAPDARREQREGGFAWVCRLAAAAAALAPSDIVTLVLIDGRAMVHPSLFAAGGLLSQQMARRAWGRRCATCGR